MINYILGALICGLITFIIARERGLKNPVIWGIGGAVFTLFAIGTVTFVKKKIKEKKDNK